MTGRLRALHKRYTYYDSTQLTCDIHAFEFLGIGIGTFLKLF
jgi:hypothetical protein